MVTQLGTSLAEFFKGQHISGDDGRFLNLFVQKAGNDSIKELSSHFAEEKLRLREFNELFPCLTACEWQSWDWNTDMDTYQLFHSHSEHLGLTGQKLFRNF